MKFLVLFFLLAVLPGIAYTQVCPGQSEVSASYGLHSFQVAFGSGMGGGSGGEEVTDEAANRFITYRYYISGRFSIGCTLGIQQYSGAKVNESGEIISFFDYNYVTLAPECLFNYVNKKWIRVYTYLGIGASFYSKKQTADSAYYHGNNVPVYNKSSNYFGVNAQYVPLGISIGGKLVVFGELGIGYKGFYNFGLAYRFPYCKTLAKSNATDNSGK